MVGFSTYAFPVTGGSTSRTLPVRLADEYNVKDFGAIGNGVADDRVAIQSAIDKALTRANQGLFAKGCVVRLPPGNYFVSKPIFMGRSPTQAGQDSGIVELRGAGRDVTRVFGNISPGWGSGSDPPSYYGYIFQKEEPNFGFYNAVQTICDMTVENLSTFTGTGNNLAAGGCIILKELSVSAFTLRNCRLKGACGLRMHPTYVSLVEDCIIECNIPFGAANSAIHAPTVGTVGLYPFETQIVNCKISGFDWGIAQGGIANTIIGCEISRCNVAMFIGESAPIDIDQSTCSAIFGNIIDRCTRGMYFQNVVGIGIFANTIQGTDGVADAAAMASASKSVNTVTVVTSLNHNLPAGVSLLHLKTNPAGWTPNGTGNQIVSCTNTAPNQFQYSHSLATPGALLTGSTWNYPLDSCMQVGGLRSAFLAANKMDAIVRTAFDPNAAANSVIFESVMYCSEGPSGWTQPWGDHSVGIEFVQCGANGLLSSQVPHAWLRFDHRPGQGQIYPYVGFAWDGCQRYFKDCQPQSAFGGVLAGASTNAYKGRYNAAANNWTRVG